MARLHESRPLGICEARWESDRRDRHKRHARVSGSAAGLLPIGARHKMGRTSVDEFARFYVIPQTGHGLTGSTYTMNGDGRAIPATQIPSRFDRVSMLLDWVEKGAAPPKSATLTGNASSLPLCSYRTYPRYNAGSSAEAASYSCVAP